MGMIIHEVIYFTHELDLLECHLEEHSSFVDKTIIKESSILWSGKPKPLIFTENIGRFSRFKNIEVIVIPNDEFEYMPSSYKDSEGKKWFDARRRNREVSRRYRWEDITTDADYVLSMDCDEIIDERRWPILEEMLSTRHLEYVCIRLRQYNQWVNNQQKIRDIYRVFRGSSPYRNNPKGFPRAITSCIGWHFTNIYDAVGLKMKLEGICSHEGYLGYANTPTIEEIKARLDAGEIYKNGRKPKNVIDRDKMLPMLPRFMREHPERFPWYD
jgi:hypothetical protein